MPNVGEVCNRNVVVARRVTALVDVAVLMRDQHVGDVVVVGDVLTRPAVTARDDEDILHAAHRMRVEGVRRMPVVDKDGGLPTHP